MQISGKSVLITGGGSGIGRALALSLARLGTRLTLVGRRAESLAETAEAIERLGAPVRTIAADIGDPAVLPSLVRSTVKAFGALDVLVNNAGAVRASRLEAIPADEILAMININLVVPILLTREALPALRRSGDGLVINVASGNALIGMPFYAVYAAAKAGLARFSEALRRELSGEGVRVLTVFPGATRTPMMASSKAGPELGFAMESPEEVAASIATAIETEVLEVVRGGESRLKMVALNHEDPAAVDAKFAQMKPALEQAVSDHRSL